MSLAVPERWLLQVALASLVAVVIAALWSRRDASSGRTFPLLASIALLCAPLALLFDLRIPVRVDEPPSWQPMGQIPEMLVMVWLVGALALLLRLLVGWYRTRRYVASLPPVTEPRVAAARAELNTPPSTEVVCDASASAPYAMAAKAPTVALPSGWQQWSDATLQAVLAHEATHLARRDSFWQVFVYATVSVYWVFPWMWLMPAVFRRHMEASCDDAASEWLADPVGYCNALGEVALRSAPSRLPQAVGFGGGALSRRIRRFLGVRSRELRVSTLYWSTLTAFFAVPVLCAVEFEQAPTEPALGADVALKSVVLTPPVAPAPSIQVSRYSVLQSGRMIAADAGVVLPRTDQPIYPGHALLQGQQGEVWVEFGLSSDGHVIRPSVVSAQPPDVFNSASLRAVERGEYHPRAGSLPGTTHRLRVRHQYRLPSVEPPML